MRGFVGKGGMKCSVGESSEEEIAEGAETVVRGLERGDLVSGGVLSLFSEHAVFLESLPCELSSYTGEL